jgi:predicted  nucleic acid-binding Zn-ribbon protein
MKKIFWASAGIVALGLAGAGLAMAADTPLDEAKKAAVVANCSNAQSTLQSINRSDITTRVNRGRSYDQALKLFYAMNARLASNNITEPRLAEITKNFEDELNSFRSQYNDYNDRLKNTTDIDCRQEPQQFYDVLGQARDRRSAVHGSIVKLNNLIGDYQNTIKGLAL